MDLVVVVINKSIMSRKMLIDGEVGKSNNEEANYDFDLFVISRDINGD